MIKRVRGGGGGGGKGARKEETVMEGDRARGKDTEGKGLGVRD